MMREDQSRFVSTLNYIQYKQSVLELLYLTEQMYLKEE